MPTLPAGVEATVEETRGDVLGRRREVEAPLPVQEHDVRELGAGGMGAACGPEPEGGLHVGERIQLRVSGPVTCVKL